MQYEYLGTKRCRSCHGEWAASWKKFAKGHSWDALKPGEDAEVKRAAGLDVDVDYTTDTRCLACHTVGFGRPTGYAIPDPKDESSIRSAATRQGVGCEACHGPGSGFVEIMQDVVRTGRTYRPAELYATGRKPVTLKVCVKCHNERAICVAPKYRRKPGQEDVAGVLPDLSDTRGYHEHFPLEHRESSEYAPTRLEKRIQTEDK